MTNEQNAPAYEAMDVEIERRWQELLATEGDTANMLFMADNLERDGWPQRAEAVRAAFHFIDKQEALLRILLTERNHTPPAAGDAVAWYVELVAPGMKDHGQKVGPWWSRSEAEGWVNSTNVLRPLFASPAAPPSVTDAVEAALSHLKVIADNAYVDGCHQHRKTECLGREHKLAKGTFGEAEYRAHEIAIKHFARHFAIHEAIKAIRASLAALTHPGHKHAQEDAAQEGEVSGTVEELTDRPDGKLRATVRIDRDEYRALGLAPLRSIRLTLRLTCLT